MKMINLIMCSLSFLIVSCQVDSVNIDNSSREFLKNEPCSKIPLICPNCKDTESLVAFEKKNGAKFKQLAYKHKLLGYHLDLTDREWDKFNYKSFFEIEQVYQRKKEGDFIITSFNSDNSQTLTYELDTSLVRYKNKSLEELQATVKQKMMSVVNCYAKNGKYKLDYTLEIYEGFGYRDGIEQELYKRVKNPREKHSVNVLHLYQVDYIIKKNKTNISMIYDDLVKRNKDGYYESTVMFKIKIRFKN